METIDFKSGKRRVLLWTPAVCTRLSAVVKKIKNTADYTSFAISSKTR